MRKALSLTLIATMLSLPVAQAKNRDKAWEFGLQATHVDGDKDAMVNNGVGATLMFGYNVSAKIEAELAVTSNVVDFTSAGELVNLSLAGTGAFVVGEVPDPENSFIRAVLMLTGNFFTDRETRFVPYVSAGLGIIQETVDSFPLTLNIPNPFHDPNGPMDPNTNPTRVVVSGETFELFDASAILSLSVGARTFLSDNWGIRYEVRYNHHDSFDVSQDEYQVSAGITWIVGGQK